MTKEPAPGKTPGASKLPLLSVAAVGHEVACVTTGVDVEQVAPQLPAALAGVSTLTRYPLPFAGLATVTE